MSDIYMPIYLIYLVLRPAREDERNLMWPGLGGGWFVGMVGVSA